MKAVLFIIIMFLFFGCATVTPMGSTYSDEDPFKMQLDKYDRLRVQQDNESLVLALVTVGTLFSGVVIQNIGSFGYMDKQTANAIAGGCYAGTAIAVGFDIGQFFTVRNTNDEYMKLLRLQNQYYNMIHWGDNKKND